MSHAEKPISRILLPQSGGNHSSRPCVAERFKRPTRRRCSEELGTGSPAVFLFGLAPRGVYLAEDVTTHAGELLPHHFTLDPFGAGIFSVALVVGSDPPGCYPARCPLVFGLSSIPKGTATAERLTHGTLNIITTSGSTTTLCGSGSGDCFCRFGVEH